MPAKLEDAWKTIQVWMAGVGFGFAPALAAKFGVKVGNVVTGLCEASAFVLWLWGLVNLGLKAESKE